MDYYDPDLDGTEIQAEVPTKTNKATPKSAKTTEKEVKTCPLCSRVVTLGNATLIKLEGRRVCGDCARKLTAVYPGKFSYKNVSIDTAKKAIKTYVQPNPTPTPTEPRPPKKSCCPKCGSQNIMPMGHKHKNISLGKAAGGAVLFGGVGLAAGFLGKTEKKVEFYCSNCGNVFKRK